MQQSDKKSFFDRFKRNQSSVEIQAAEETIKQAPPESTEKTATPSFMDRMRKALTRTSSGFTSLFLGAKKIDADILEELETLLLIADVGVEVTGSIIQELTDRVSRNQLQDGAALHTALKDLLLAKLAPCEVPFNIELATGPHITLVVGVNGVGKTTTIGKIASYLKQQGKSVILAAGDTFRAAAVEQLQAWGDRNQVPVVAQHTGADSASVIFDAIQAASSRNVDAVIADTAGRLHNKSNLMEELEKVKRVAGKLDSNAPHEVLLVLDAATGQNAVVQMAQFHQTVGVTGIALTKLDGTAKGGVIFALAEKFNVPIRFIGVGEGQNDLQPFVASDFVDALLGVAQSD